MTNEECFAIWAPEGVVWSRWAKPVAFTQLAPTTFTHAPLSWDAPEMARVPDPRHTALVVDVPAVDAVRIGVALAEIGYRPVPLFNATTGITEVLNLHPMLERLAAGAERLRERQPRPDAPPAFLLDAKRMTPPTLPIPGKFDNRWVTLPQDFPSALFLKTRGIQDVTVLRADGLAPGQDLMHVLRRWQDGGLRIALWDLSESGDPQPFQVPRPSYFRLAWYGLIALMGLRRNEVGGFGAAIPEAGSGGFGGFYG
jgi:hypothetical protein